MPIPIHKAGDGSGLEDSKVRLGQASFLAYLPNFLAQSWQCETSFYGIITGFNTKQIEFTQIPDEKRIKLPREQVLNLMEEGEILFDPLSRDEADYAGFKACIRKIVEATSSLSEMLIEEPELLMDWKNRIFFGNLRVMRGLKTKEWLLNYEDWFDKEEQDQINWILLSEWLSETVGF